RYAGQTWQQGPGFFVLGRIAEAHPQPGEEQPRAEDIEWVLGAYPADPIPRASSPEPHRRSVNVGGHDRTLDVMGREPDNYDVIEKTGPRYPIAPIITLTMRSRNPWRAGSP